VSSPGPDVSLPVTNASPRYVSTKKAYHGRNGRLQTGNKRPPRRLRKSLVHKR